MLVAVAAVTLLELELILVIWLELWAVDFALIDVVVIVLPLLPPGIASVVDGAPLAPTMVDCGELLAPVEDTILLPLAALVRAVIMSVGRLVSVPMMELISLDKERGMKTEPRELGFARAAEPIEEPRLSAAEVWEGV